MKCNSTKCRAVHAGSNNRNFCLELGPHHLEMTERERKLFPLLCGRGWGAASMVKLEKAHPRPCFSHQEWVSVSSAALPRREHSQELCRALPLGGQRWKSRERLWKELSSSARREGGLAGAGGENNDQKRPECNERRGNKQRGGRKLLKLKDCLGTRTNAACRP